MVKRGSGPASGVQSVQGDECVCVCVYVHVVPTECYSRDPPHLCHAVLDGVKLCRAVLY